MKKFVEAILHKKELLQLQTIIKSKKNDKIKFHHVSSYIRQLRDDAILS